MFRHPKLAAVAFLLLAAPCLADEPVGTWKLKCVSPDGKDRSCLVKVAREGGRLTGTYVADGETRPVKEVSFVDGVMSIAVDGHFAGQVYGLTYRARPAGGALRGTVRWSYGIAAGSFAFEGERVAATTGR